ncbi:hypothetical protein O3M35_008906 [Rhynocoris fuscipes]|uniref:4'-phosphopantetheine phosphatase n=1 Tax=Rhynocoris fuscipes TaxID=488301 RepID=A0AAW1DF98_9HEMI
MVFIANLIKINDITSLTVHLSSQWSTISCYHKVNFVDIINESSDLQSIAGKRISVFKFRTDNIKAVLSIIRNKLGTRLCNEIRVVTNLSLADSYIKDIESTLQLSCFTDNDNISYSAVGANFIINNTINQLYKYKNKESSYFLENNDNLYPYLLVLIDSNIIFIKVISDNNSEIIYETPFDFNFLLKISNTVNGTKSLEDIFQYLNEVNIEISHSGTCHSGQSGDNSDCKSNNNDNIIYYMVQTLLHNLCDIIMLQSDKHNIKNVIIGEYFNNTLFLDTINGYLEKLEAKNFDVYFMRHNGLTTAIGALSKDISKSDYNNSWLENYAISSGFIIGRDNATHLINFYLAFDSNDTMLVPLPLLNNPSSYRPHILDFTIKYFRDYWLNCAEKSVESSVKAKIDKDQNGQDNSALLMFLESFRENIKFLKNYPSAFGVTTFMVIQHFIQQLKKEFGLHNSYYTTKRNECKAGLNNLKEWLKYFDDLPADQRCIEVSKSLLAGNMFDWGSAEINKLFVSNRLDFKSALSIIPERPWLKDDLDLWKTRMNGPPYKFAAIFPDNCGFDFILGIIPFARELIKKGTKIAFCANVEPVLNDVTTNDIKILLEDICNLCPIINDAYKNNKILIVDHSRCSPCLNLRYVNKEFADLCDEIDLLVIDGMGRSVHTNFDVNIKIDCLKVAVIKDHWFSKELGGQEFAAVYSFTKAT